MLNPLLRRLVNPQIPRTSSSNLFHHRLLTFSTKLRKAEMRLRVIQSERDEWREKAEDAESQIKQLQAQLEKCKNELKAAKSEIKEMKVEAKVYKNPKEKALLAKAEVLFI